LLDDQDLGREIALTSEIKFGGSTKSKHFILDGKFQLNISLS